MSPRISSIYQIKEQNKLIVLPFKSVLISYLSAYACNIAFSFNRGRGNILENVVSSEKPSNDSSDKSPDVINHEVLSISIMRIKSVREHERSESSGRIHGSTGQMSTGNNSNNISGSNEQTGSFD